MSKNRCFTLIKLLIVIAIVGILVSMVIITIQGRTHRIRGYVLTESGEMIEYESYMFRYSCVMTYSQDGNEIICGSFRLKPNK